MDSYAVKMHYLDASALVKLVAEDPDDEPGRTAIRAYFKNHTDFITTFYCLSEVFSVFKAKFFYRKKINQDQYVKYLRTSLQTIVVRLEIEKIPILSPQVLDEAEFLIRKYNLDFSDCIQIVTILHGNFSVLSADSKSILITADRNLAKTARGEGARVWDCMSEPSPLKIRRSK